MNALRFVDTNVLLYATSLPPVDARKRSRARELLKRRDLIVSVQVLQEFYYQATRTTRPGRLTSDDALRFLEPLVSMRVQALTLDLFRTAVAISQRHRLSYWDGAILAAARAAGCDIVYSEDMNHGQDYGGVRVVNPFADRLLGT